MLLVRMVLGEAILRFLATLTATTAMAFFMLAITFLDRAPGIGLGFLVELFPLFLPLALQFAIPLSVLGAVVYTMARMSADGEIAALSSCAVPLGRVIRPLLAGAAVVAVSSIYLLDVTGPLAEERLRLSSLDLAKRLRTTFRSGLCDLELGSNRISFESFSGDTFRDICIEWGMGKYRDQIWRAESGRIAITDGNAIVLSLENLRAVVPIETERGAVHLAGKDLVFRHPLDTFIGQDRMQAKRSSMQAWELAYVIDRKIPNGVGYRTSSLDAGEELARRTALGASAFFFALIGIPLGVIGGRAGRLGGFLFALAPIIVLYFPIVLASIDLARRGHLPAYPALWAGNVLLGVVGLFLLRRINHP